MSTKSHLEELLALRPAHDQVEAIEAAIEGINAKAVSYGERAEELRLQRKNSLMKLPAEKLLALEHEAAALDIAVEQADELLGTLTLQLTDRQKADAFEVLVTTRPKIAEEIEAFRSEFHDFYETFLKKFEEMLQKVNHLSDISQRFNRKIDNFCNKYPRLETSGEDDEKIPRYYIESLDEKLIPNVYKTHVCLPKPGLGFQYMQHVPMSFKGEHWVSKDDFPDSGMIGFYQHYTKIGLAKEEADKRAAAQSGQPPARRGSGW